MAELTGSVGAFRLCETDGTPVVGEAVGTGNGSNKEFDLDHPLVDAVTVYLAGVAQSKTAYTVSVQGHIIFVTAPGNGVAVTADYTYYTLASPAVEGFFQWNLKWSSAAVDVTGFGDSTRQYILGDTVWTATAERHWTELGLGARLGTRGIATLYADEGNDKRLEGWGIITSCEVGEVEVGKVINEPIEMQGTEGLFVEGW